MRAYSGMSSSSSTSQQWSLLNRKDDAVGRGNTAAGLAMGRSELTCACLMPGTKYASFMRGHPMQAAELRTFRDSDIFKFLHLLTLFGRGGRDAQSERREKKQPSLMYVALSRCHPLLGLTFFVQYPRVLLL